MINKKTLFVFGTIAVITTFSPWLSVSRANSQDSLSTHTKSLSPVSVSLDGELTRKNSIVGTWRSLITPTASGTQPFYAYLTYNKGGTLIESSSDPLEGSYPGHGVWTRTTKDEFKITFEKFITFNPITQQSGVFVFKVNETINLTGDSYMGVGQVSICDNSGQQCQTLGVAKLISI